MDQHTEPAQSRFLTGEQINPTLRMTERFRTLDSRTFRWSLLVSTPEYDGNACQCALSTSRSNVVQDMRTLESIITVSCPTNGRVASVAQHSKPDNILQETLETQA